MNLADGDQELDLTVGRAVVVFVEGEHAFEIDTRESDGGTAVLQEVGFLENHYDSDQY